MGFDLRDFLVMDFAQPGLNASRPGLAAISASRRVLGSRFVKFKAPPTKQSCIVLDTASSYFRRLPATTHPTFFQSIINAPFIFDD